MPCLWLLPASVKADSSQKSIFQDDDHLIYNSTSVVQETVARLAGLGVNELRITVKWSAIAPDAASRVVPAGFDPTDPADYLASAWAPYDRVVRLAQAYGMSVEFNVTAPGPLWAMQPDAPTSADADHWEPNPAQFKAFVEALGTRYSGRYEGIPRVSVWSIWNEPNEPGWLAPQSVTVNGSVVAASADLYRNEMREAFAGLYATGHLSGHDLVLIGDLASTGYDPPGSDTAIAPMVFLRALYCVDLHYRRLLGASASALGCPTGGSERSFVDRNPALFFAGGFAHHPYYFDGPPSQPPGPDIVALANLGVLEGGLDRAMRAWGVRRHVPIYIDEWGEKSNPPDSYQDVTLADQAAYINQGQYIAWRDPRVRSMAQFLLYDTLPDDRYPVSDARHWRTFQTGLQFANGTAKPSLAAYRTPIWVPQAKVAGGHGLLVWGEVRRYRQALGRQALVQWRGHHRWTTIATVKLTHAQGYFTVVVQIPATGSLRLTWRLKSSPATTYSSRTVPVTVGR